MDVNSPSEIAREALRQLAARRVPPTPDNYRDLYFQISGTVADETFPTRAFKVIAAALPRDTPAALRHAQAFDAAVASGQWPILRQTVLELFTQAGEARSWNTLIRDLVTQFERLHGELTQARKREALTHVLAANSNAEHLYARLSSLVRSWSQASAGATLPEDAIAASGEPAPPASATPGNIASTMAGNPLRPLLAKLLANGIVPLADDDEAIAREAGALAKELAQPDGELSKLTQRLDGLVTRMEWIGEEHHAIRDSLLALLRLIVDNIHELVVDDHWLAGQMITLTKAFSGPLNLRMLDEVGRRLKDVIDKQGQLKRNLSDAQDRLKAMLAGFIDHLSAISGHTGDYHDLLERSAQKISAASSIGDLSAVVGELLQETRNTQESTRRASVELAQLREQVDSANEQIKCLQRDLDAASQLVRHDPLTGMLNRKGLDEALTREIARARRHESPFCIALLDIDNFKQINDAHGHTVGDDALRHLAQTVSETLRPQDIVARYGGEEFVILLPDTAPEAANAILVRLQRELTRRIFCADFQRLLITFSAGIAQLGSGESPEEAIIRADKAMYAAKRAGKNRVAMA
ncbi:MAG: diguanylate cyclase [Azoarcus sp.]|jgi:diguanylate cyclase|nr:diguanylate cyclase [Azoarcus sp.]